MTDADDGPLAARYGLVRPAQGRYIAGVGAALGRATRTDPVLWRVVLAVLVCFAGLGALIYLLVWLLTPEDGDTGSPLESLLGRGRSSTSPVLAGLLGIVVIGLLSVILPRPFYLMLAAALVVVLVLLINRSRTLPTGVPVAGAGEAGWPGAAGEGWAGGSPAGPPPSSTHQPVPTGSGHPPPGSVTVPTGPGTMPAAPVGAGSPPPGTPWPGTTPPGGVPPGYRPPFAPYGPYAGPSPPPPPPPPPRRPLERSRLTALVLFTAVAVLGALGIIDMTGVASIPVAAYLAASLAVVGAGLVVGAWWGRARVLIALGIVLALAMPVAHVAAAWEPPQHVGGDFNWWPADQTELEDEYSLAFGSGVLDLRQVDMTGSEITVSVRVSFGEVTILVPDEPAVEVTVESRLASVQVLDEKTEGVTRETMEDPGSGDPADGTLRLELEVQLGSAEVVRR